MSHHSGLAIDINRLKFAFPFPFFNFSPLNSLSFEFGPNKGLSYSHYPKLISFFILIFY